MELRNFGNNITFSPRLISRPGSEEELLDVLRQHPKDRFRARGSLHSWSAAPATEGVLIEMERFDAISIRGDLHSPTAMIGAGCRLEPLVDRLIEANLAMPTMGAVLEQSISGAVSTGTHGSGSRSLSSFVRRLRIVTIGDNGEPRIHEIDGGPELLAARCSLGALGIITELELELTPSWSVEERFESAADLNEVLAGEEEWPLQQFFLMPYAWKYYVYRRRKTSAPPQSVKSHVYKAWNVVNTDAVAHTIFKGLALLQKFGSDRAVIGFFKHALPKMLVTGIDVTGDSPMMLTMNHHWFRHLEMEIFVPRSRLAPAMDLVRDLTAWYAGDADTLSEQTIAALERAGIRDRVLGSRGYYAHHYPIFVRRILKDDTLISMASPRDGEPWWYSISLFSYFEPRTRFYVFADTVLDVLRSEYGARPHWGKYHSLGGSELESLYPRMQEFREICRRLDPAGRFTNDYTESVLGLGRSSK